MKNEEKLLLAIGELREDIIAEAAEPYAKGRAMAKRWIPIAAAVVLAATVSLATLPHLLGGMVKGDAAPEMGGDMTNGILGKEDYDYFENELGSLELTERIGADCFRFTLKLTSDLSSPLEVQLSTRASADNQVLYTTKENPESDAQIRRPTLTVDGVAAEALPTRMGEYEIIITFDGLDTSSGEWQSSMIFDAFGPFSLKARGLD